MKPRVQLSLAAFPGLNTEAAVRLCMESTASGGLCEPLWGSIDCEHVQLVPQNHGLLDEDLVDAISEKYPNTQFRLHANVRVLAKHFFADLGSARLYPQWFAQAARISRRLKAPAYSAHSGRRADATLEEMLDNARRLAQAFDCVVAVEGQYPTKSDSYLVSTWGEYRQLFESGVPYALDLSHLNILAAQSGQYELGLLNEMLLCDRCIEVHVSDNDGTGDWHQVCQDRPWWYDSMAGIHPEAVVFTEGNQLRQRRGP